MEFVIPILVAGMFAYGVSALINYWQTRDKKTRRGKRKKIVLTMEGEKTN